MTGEIGRMGKTVTQPQTSVREVAHLNISKSWDMGRM
jgi:hypothetical protein